MGREIRKAFVPREGWVLMAADYVQIELRILAAMSDDKALKEAFETGQDIHAAAAARVFGVPLDEVTRDQRGRRRRSTTASLWRIAVGTCAATPNIGSGSRAS
jgi:DNA polymerase I